MGADFNPDISTRVRMRSWSDTCLVPPFPPLAGTSAVGRSSAGGVTMTCRSSSPSRVSTARVLVLVSVLALASVCGVLAQDTYFTPGVLRPTGTRPGGTYETNFQGRIIYTPDLPKPQPEVKRDVWGGPQPAQGSTEPPTIYPGGGESGQFRDTTNESLPPFQSSPPWLQRPPLPPPLPRCWHPPPSGRRRPHVHRRRWASWSTPVQLRPSAA